MVGSGRVLRVQTFRAARVYGLWLTLPSLVFRVRAHGPVEGHPNVDFEVSMVWVSMLRSGSTAQGLLSRTD